jgi:hypothetical protein
MKRSDEEQARAQATPREGWEEAFRRLRAAGDDIFEEESVSLTSFDEIEWTW